MSRTEAVTLPGDAPMTLSTREVARILGVGEATVKRWADDERLSCRRTPGGHRRFSLSDVAGFRESHPGWHEAWPVSAEVARNELLLRALRGDGTGLARLALSGIDSGLSVARFCDEWLAPMLMEVRHRRQVGRLSVGQEHLVLAAMAEMLSQIAPFVQMEPVEGVALTATPGGARHDLDVRMAGLVLRAHRCRVVHLGAEVPTGEVAREAEREGARIVVLGDPAGPAGGDALWELGRWGLRRGVAVFAVGYAAREPSPPGVENVTLMDRLVQQLEALRPGRSA
jgi:excisionase family DNA binding protein